MYRLPSDLNVEVEGVDVETVKKLRNKIQNQKLKFFLVSFEGANFLLQENRDVNGADHDS
jgi:peroxiredoxin